MTIRTKLILWYSGLLAFIVVVFGLIVFAFMRWTLISSIDETLTRTADQVVRDSRALPIGELGSPDSVSIRLPALDVFSGAGLFVQVWDFSDQQPSYAASSNNISDLRIPLDEDSLALEMQTLRNVRFGDTQMRVLTRPVPLPSDSVMLSVQVGASLEPVLRSMERLLTVLLIAMTVAVGGSVAVGAYISHRALKPIDAIIQGAAKITEMDDLSLRLPWMGPMDELGRLTSVFNRMMDRLEHLFGVQRRFVGDVSHELRTPLTAIRGHLDLIERYGVDDVSLEAISSEVGRMSRMVNDLLLLARADYGGVQLELGPIDLDTVVMEAYRDANSIVHARGSELEVKLGRFEPVRINGNGDRLKQLLLNLVGNAVKFTPPGGEIKLSLTGEGPYAVMRVSDTGIGIAASELPLIFERLYQGESSRANTEMDNGTGLGLSICKWIAESHEGTIKVDSELGKGTMFTISIPRIEYTTATKSNITITAEMRQLRRLQQEREKTPPPSPQ